ncbi:MAG: protease complex subunit PrcB family protein [Halobacteriales archaeon]|nr:protease complex subunit PrcB family protein [Halobacteriales archaeon]
MAAARIVAWLSLLALLAGCTEVSQGPGTTPTAPRTGTATGAATATHATTTAAATGTATPSPGGIPFRVLESGDSSGIETDGFEGRVVRSQAEWEAFWAEHRSNTNPPGTPPAVDFSREAVVALFMGQQPSSGYAIEVTQVADGVTGLVVHYATTRPGDGCVTAAVVTQPFQMAAVEAGADFEMGFTLDEERTHDCGP